MRAELQRLRRGTPKTKRVTNDQEDDTERRRLLQIAVSSAGLSAFSGEPVRQLLELSLGHEFRSIEEWELTCADHLHALRTRPPMQVATDLAIDLLALQRQMDSADAPRNTPDLHRVMAALSTLHANALTRLGDHAMALRWWGTARRAADASGDLELMLGVRATETGHNLYGQRDPITILRLTQSAQEIAKGRPSVGLALVLCSEAKVLTYLGRHNEARRTLETFRDMLASVPPPATIMSGYWNGGQLPFAETQIYAGAGDEDAAHAAGEQLLAFTSDYQAGATVRLHEALCMVVNGGIDQGMQLASSVIDALPQVHNDTMVVETGRRVLRAVPPDQRERPTVNEFRELLAIEPPPHT